MAVGPGAANANAPPRLPLSAPPFSEDPEVLITFTSSSRSPSPCAALDKKFCTRPPPRSWGGTNRGSSGILSSNGRENAPADDIIVTTLSAVYT